MVEFDITPWAPESSFPDGSGVFHYTDAAGLLGIIQSGTLWATEAVGLNDSREVTAGQDELTRRISAEEDPEVRDILEDRLPPPLDESGPSGVFVLSASRRNDDANQWRLYGDGGVGYCVELDGTVPLVVRTEKDRHDRETVHTRPDGGLVIDFGSMCDDATVTPWTRVLYTDEERNESFDHLVEWVRGAVDSAANAHAGNPEEGDVPPEQILAYEVERAKGTFTRIVKESGFSGEDEVRTVVTFALGVKHACFRAGRFGITRYVKLTRGDNYNSSGPGADIGQVWFASGNDTRDLPIRSITLGPKLNPDLGREAVESLLVQHGYRIKDISVQSSSVPLR